VVVVVGVIGPLVAPFDPNHADLSRTLLPAGSDGHLLGTDSAGRDVLSRLLIGTQNTLLAAALASSVALIIGVPTGLIAGYFGKWFDGVASWCTNVLMSLPSIVVLLAAAAALGKTVWVSMTIFGILMSPGFFRLTRTSVRAVRNELYLDAARVSGLSTTRIIGRHVLFVVRPQVIIQASMLGGVAVSLSATLDFLGLGDALVPTWGVMLNEAFLNIFSAPILVVWPALAVSATICAFIVLGNALRDALEDTPRVKRRSRPHPIATMRTTGLTLPAPEPSSSHLLSVSGLGLGYPQPDGGFTTVVDDVSLHVDRGEVLGIVGESGSGKTQTAFSILGLLPVEAEVVHGSIVFDGASLVSAAGSRLSSTRLQALRGRRIAYVPQEPMSNLDPNFRIGHQLARPMVKTLGISRSEARERALELLAKVRIPNPERTFNAYPHEISGGMAQRVLIAGAVSCKPDLLIADEPTTALDVTVQAEVLDLLRELQVESQMGLILVTHNFGVVADLCDRVVVMRNGRVVETGDVRSILGHPAQPYTQSLLAATLDDKAPLTMLGSAPEAGVR